MRPVPSLFVAVVATAAVCGGCGGSDSGVAFSDVRGCLERLGPTGAVFPGTDTASTSTTGSSGGDQVVPDAIADVRFKETATGAAVAHLVFYGNRSDTSQALEQTQSGGVAGAPEPELAAKTVLVTWSTPPTQDQRNRVFACLEQQ
jgi:hypothetical protein